MLKQPWWQESLSIFSRLSGWVLLPLIAGTLFGRWLDRKYDSEPKWFFIVIGVAFLISMVGLVIQARKEMKRFTK
jgi:membrane protein DedA with SNARE-associated domain